MKKILLALTLILGYANVYSQCTPNTLYQDSAYGIWPDTVQNLPTCLQNVSYLAEITIKTPETLIEAAGGDSTMTQLDTVVMGTTISENLAAWPVDSLVLAEVIGSPTGLTLDCADANCVLPGNALTCAYVSGTTSDPVGVYPIVILVDVYTHGVLDLGIIQYPLSTSLYEATGDYDSILGYNIVISNSTSIELVNSKEFTLLQNIPNPSNGVTTIQFNTPNADKVNFVITDMFGKVVYSESIISNRGMNSVEFNNKLSSGIYTYSIQNEDKILSKRMIISE